MDKIIESKVDAPTIWIGLFMIKTKDGKTAERPLTYMSPDDIPVNSIAYQEEAIPELIAICNLIAKASGYEWRLVEFQPFYEWNKNLFPKMKSASIH